MGTVKERVKADLDASRLWKARDRLRGVLRVDASNQWALQQLGDVYFRMGDLPEAGRVWFLTARSGPEWEAAENAFYQRYGKTPSGVVNALAVRAAIERFPPVVQERLGALQRRLAAEGRFWKPRDRPRTPPRKRAWLSGTVIGFVVLLFILALLVGFYNMALFLIHAGQ